MNYLGHLFFSGGDTELMLANLYGDFVKGSDLGGFSPKTREGILLHRSIDSYIDTHPAVRELLHELYPQLPKVAGIAVDLFFDHLLARDWHRYHAVPLENFLQRFYDSADVGSEEFSPQFRNMMGHLVRMNWISYYPTLDGLDKACNGVSSRLSFPNELKNGLQVFLEHEKRITEVFELYMKDASLVFGA